ncbi:MFS transporter [Protofrankia symbiont of Coriaria ruscifolia]|uniref:MFS transporter n=1 Tax=Protofrankia symbiont of Coriaria ruscifolia TaxID=1306542 RepID=UPI0010418974|nr:MFS transporter [Protofrankia symbiont of Coriaria ruscifolia]
MYTTLRDRPSDPPQSGAFGTAPAAISADGTTLAHAERGGAARRVRRAVGSTVLLLGLTSLLTDLSTEMVTAVLPLYLVGTLGFSPFQYGLVNGFYQGASVLVRLVSGLASDRWMRHRDVAAVGYAMSALAKGALVVGATSPVVVSGSLAGDRIGKGLRTAPRDALLSLAARESDLGFVFGVHRAMDTVGAMLGPFVAFMLLAASPDSYDLVFVVSACVALIGVAVIVLLVERHPPGTADVVPDGDTTGDPMVSDPVLSDAVAPDAVAPGTVPAPAGAPDEDDLLGYPTRPLRAAVALLADSGYRTLVIAAVVLSLCAIGDGFIYLRLQQEVDLAAYYFPLLAAGTSCVYLGLAVPLGRIADRVGRARMLITGYAALVTVYLVLLVPRPGVATLVGCLALLGAFYAATDGILPAAASALLPPGSRTTGIALLQTGVTLGQLAASVGFGAVWTFYGARPALWLAGGSGAVGCVLAVAVLSRAAAFRSVNDGK